MGGAVWLILQCLKTDWFNLLLYMVEYYIDKLVESWFEKPFWYKTLSVNKSKLKINLTAYEK